VLKPAEQTPLSALRLGELIQEAGFLKAQANASKRIRIVPNVWSPIRTLYIGKRRN